LPERFGSAREVFKKSDIDSRVREELKALLGELDSEN
jgi:hypothetical protein